MKKLLSIMLAAALVFVLLPSFALGVSSEETEDRGDIAIHEVNILGFRPPVIGSTPEYSYSLYVEEGQGYFIIYQYWYDNTLGADMTTEQIPFDADHLYSIGCLVSPEEGYYFADDCVYSFNGSPDLVDPAFFNEHYLFTGSYFVQTVPTAPVSGSIMPGDVNEDLFVNSQDALMALRAGMGILELTASQQAAADVDHSGSVDSIDALTILRYALGMIEEL